MKPNIKILIIAISLLLQVVPIGIGAIIGSIDNTPSVSIEPSQDVKIGLTLSETNVSLNKPTALSFDGLFEKEINYFNRSNCSRKNCHWCKCCFIF